LSIELTEKFHKFFNPDLDWDRDPTKIEGEWKLYEFGECPCSFHINIEFSPLPQEFWSMTGDEVVRNLPEHTGIIQIDLLNLTEHPHAEVGGEIVVLDEDNIGTSTFPHELGHSLGLTDLYQSGQPRNTITEEEERRFKGSLMGKKDRRGKRRITAGDITRIAEITGMTCKVEICCPNRGEKDGRVVKVMEKESRVGQVHTGLTPTGAILDLLDPEERALHEEKPPQQPKILFTKNGKRMPPPIPAPPGANDVHADFDPQTGKFIKIYWTKDGERIGQPIPIPEGANDLAFGFDDFEQFPPPQHAPPGANDFEFFWDEYGRYTGWWTKDGHRMEPVPVELSNKSIHIDISNHKKEER
jgi:hypothetical protein